MYNEDRFEEMYNYYPTIVEFACLFPIETEKIMYRGKGNSVRCLTLFYRWKGRAASYQGHRETNSRFKAVQDHQKRQRLPLHKY